MIVKIKKIFLSDFTMLQNLKKNIWQKLQLLHKLECEHALANSMTYIHYNRIANTKFVDS